MRVGWSISSRFGSIKEILEGFSWLPKMHFTKFSTLASWGSIALTTWLGRIWWYPYDPWNILVVGLIRGSCIQAWISVLSTTISGLTLYVFALNLLIVSSAHRPSVCSYGPILVPCEWIRFFFFFLLFPVWQVSCSLNWSKDSMIDEPIQSKSQVWLL